MHPLVYLFICEAARELHLHLLRMLKEESVADGSVALPRHLDAETDTEKVRVGATDGQAAGVIVDIGRQAGEHIITFGDKVVVATLEEEAVGAVVFLQAVL